MSPKGTEFVTLVVILMISVILVPIAVTQIQNSASEVDWVEDTVSLYPQADDSLDLTEGSGVKNATIDSTGDTALSNSSILVSGISSDAEKLGGTTVTVYYNATADQDNNANVTLYVDVGFSNGTSIQTGAAETDTLTGSYAVHSATFSWPEGTVDQTDTVEVNWVASVDDAGGASENASLSLAGSRLANVQYSYESIDDGWSFTGGSGARTLMLLLPFILIAGVVIYYVRRLV